MELSDNSRTISTQPAMSSIFSPHYLLYGLLYTCCFHGVWLISSHFETVTSTVSWYLPAGVRLGAFLLLPMRSWPALLLCEKLTHLLLFSPGGLLDNSQFMSGSVYWYLVHLMITPLLLCAAVYTFRRFYSSPYLDNVSSTLSLLSFSMLLSIALGFMFLGRRALESNMDVVSFLVTLFEFSLGDFVGIVVIVPILITLYTKQCFKHGGGQLYYIVAGWLLALSGSVLAFDNGINLSYQLKYIAVLPALYLAHRFGIYGSSLSCILIGVTAFLVSSQTTLNPLEHQFYIIALCVSSLILGASVTQAKRMNTTLALSNAKIREKNALLNKAIDNTRAVTAKLVAVQEEERRKLSRDLHDDFGHRIVDLKLQLSLKKNEDLSTVLSEKIDSLYFAMKKSLGSLRPSGIDTLSIEAVLQRSEIISSLNASNIAYTLNISGTAVALENEKKIHIYRIIQEAVTNSIKHANATRLNIDVVYHPTVATFTISDNGMGIPASYLTDSIKDAPVDFSMGILSMHERAHLIRGKLSILKNTPSGTVVSIAIEV